VLFLSHGGGPCFYLDGNKFPRFKDIDKNSKGAQFFRNLPALLPRKPDAIVVVSAHWEDKGFNVGVNTPEEPLLYDYYGFPDDGYAPQLTYPVPTNHELAKRITNSLQGISGKPSRIVTKGFDHGVFVPLKLMFPNADVPIVEVSLDRNLLPSDHIKLGEALSYLRSENILIIGSGSATHNFNADERDSTKITQYLAWLKNTLESANPDNAAAVKTKIENMLVEDCPHASYFHPRIEHLLPLHVAVGAAFPFTSGAKLIFTQVFMGAFSMDSYMFS